MDQDATWYDGRPRPKRLCVRWGLSSPAPKRGHPKFSAHLCCDQTATWIKLPFGTEVGLDPNDIVLDGEKLKLLITIILGVDYTL